MQWAKDIIWEVTTKIKGRKYSAENSLKKLKNPLED